MKVRASIIIAIAFVLSASRPEPITDRIKLYSWWEYIAPDAVKRLENLKFPIDLTVYKTNELAISRLIKNTDQFDVAVVSSIAIPVLRDLGVIETGVFAETAKKRNYLSLVKDSASDCLPYLWSSTVFFYDSRIVEKAPTTIADLAALKKNNIKIAIIDDIFEVAARVFGDAGKICGVTVVPENIFDSLRSCTANSLPYLPTGLAATDFVSEVATILKDGGAAGYGWHGEHSEFLQQHSWLRSAPANRYPVVGFDAVCILKNRKNKHDLDRLKNFVETMTNKEMTTMNVSSTQYFSPYIGDRSGLHPRSKNILDAIESNIKVNTPMVLKSPDSAHHGLLNKWWQRLRYGSQ